MVVLAAEDQERPILVVVDSLGGSASEAMGIVSTMNGIRCSILTFCRGPANGPAALIAAHGRKGFRTATPAARFSFKLSSFSDAGEADFESISRWMAEWLVKDTGRTSAEVIEWFKGGVEFGPQEALQRGLIDVIANEPVFPKTG